MKYVKHLLALAILTLCSFVSAAEDRWVTDEFEIMMRTGKSSKQRIVRQLSSGTQVELLEVDDESGFSRVVLPSGQEGWVISRYLKPRPTAQIVLPQVQAQLESSNARQTELRKQVKDLQNEKQGLQREVSELQSSNRSLQDQLDRITKLSSNTIQVDDQNRALKEQLANSQRQIDALENDNDRLGSRANREWFLGGAAVLIAGLLFGLILPRLNFRKKSSWSDF